MCGDPLSPCRATQCPHYTCRNGFPWASCVAVVSGYTLREGTYAPVANQLQGVSHVELPLKRHRATKGWSSYTGRVSRYTVELCIAPDVRAEAKKVHILHVLP